MPERFPMYAVNASALSTDPREAVTLARQLGFAGMLFDAYSPTLNITELSATGRRDFRHVLSAQDRQLIGFRVDVGRKGLGPGADIDRLLSEFRKLLETTAAMAAPLVCVDLGPLPPAPPLSAPKPKVTPEQAGLILIPTFTAPEPEPPPPAPRTPADIAFESQVNLALLELGALADHYRVTLALHSDLSSFASLQRALLSANCPWFGVNLDPVSMLRDDWEMDEIFSRFGPLIRHVRGRDAVVGADKRTKPASIGRGDTKWDHLLDNLQHADYHGWISLDPTELADRRSAVVAGLKYLRLHE